MPNSSQLRQQVDTGVCQMELEQILNQLCSLIRSTVPPAPPSPVGPPHRFSSKFNRSKSADATNRAIPGEPTSPVWFQHQDGKSSSYVATQHPSAPGHQQGSFTRQGRRCFLQSDTEQLDTSWRRRLA